MHREECSAPSSESWDAGAQLRHLARALFPHKVVEASQQDRDHFDENSHSTGTPPVSDGLIHSEGQLPCPNHLSKAPSLNTMTLAAKLPMHKLLAFRPYDQQKHTDRDKTLPRSLQGLTEQRHSGATKEVVYTTDCCELCDIPPVPTALNSILYIILGYFTLL